MAADFTIKADDTEPPIIAVLSETVSGVLTVIDLTTATTVKLIMSNGSVTKTGTCTISNAAAGEVTYAWATGDTATAGDYTAEYEITWPGPKYETVPNDGYFTVEIVADLGGTV